MKTLLLLLLLFVAGCVDIEYMGLKYKRVGPQQLVNMEVLITDPNGRETLITFDKQESDGYAEVIKMLIERIPR